MSEIIFTAYLMGGLGNQMFQIANAYSQGLKNNTKVLFKKVADTPMQANQPTKYLDNIYKKLNFTDEKFQTSRIGEASWNEANLNFIPNTNIEFYGYFQSSKNFLGYDKEIKSLFEPDETFLKKIFEIYGDLDNSLTLHVRRGDYLSVSNFLPIIDLSYINYCVSQFPNYSKLLIFSDDKKWVRENLNFRDSILVDNLEDYEELWLMSLCNNNIISNSTFSWWGSFLNKKNNRVLCPSIWFGPSGPYPYYNIYEKDWEKINVNYENGKLILL